MKARMRPRRAIRWVAIGAISLGALWQVATVPSTARQGVNFQVSTSTLPLYVKAIDFLHRHEHYRLLANEITRGCHSGQERVLAVFAWTRGNIRRTPKGWPIVDDHVWNIMIRGHGLGDQMADVFTTLATYAGLPAFWRPGVVTLSFVQVEGRWTMFDVANGLIFTDARGQLADVNELLRDPKLIQMTSGSLAVGDRPYEQYVARLRPFHVPAVLRARQQMPLPRLFFEAKRLLRLVPAAEAPQPSVRPVEAP